MIKLTMGHFRVFVKDDSVSESAIEEAKWDETQQKCYVAEQESLSGVKWSEMRHKYGTPTHQNRGVNRAKWRES